MLARPIDEITPADLEALVENRISESRRLEFKRDHYGRKDEDKREFAADVSAMANGSGGDIIIGIAEESGAASELTGVVEENPDKLMLAIIDSLRSSIEPLILGLRVVHIKLPTGRVVIIVRVPRSWNAPHRVTVAKDNRFFIRDENGKHPMSVEELRRSFLFGTEVESRLRNFRIERLKLLADNEGPLAIAAGNPCMIVHVVPLTSLIDPPQIEFDPSRAGLAPLGASGWNNMFSIDGLVTYSGLDERFKSVGAFTTLFRNGIAEAVGTVYTGEVDGLKTLSLKGIEQSTARFLRECVREYAHYNIGPPTYLMLSLTGVRGLSASFDSWYSGLAIPHRSDKVLLPELRIEGAQLADETREVLQPIFDLLWNAFGRRGSPNSGRE
jgi:hypothetical protein